jgi:hypothetical protein
MLQKARDEHAKITKHNMIIETNMARMKFDKARRNRHPTDDVLEENDALFGTYKPEFYKQDSIRNN